MRVVITRQLPGKSVQEIQAAGHEIWVHAEDSPLPLALLLEQVRSAHGLLAMLTDRVDEALLEQAPLLKVVANYAVGFDNIDLEACRAKGIVVTNTPDVLTDATADLTWALILAAARRIAEGDSLTRAGGFTGWEPTMLLGRAVRGATLGILGAGRIGQAVARRSAGFDMRVIYTSPRPWTAGTQTLGAQAVSLETLLRESDFLSLHAPLNEATRHVIRRETLAQMKPTAILVNTARGGLVCEADLLEALNEGTVLGAGLDVFDPEPPSADNPLLHHPRITLSPHLGSATVQAREAMAALAVRNLLAVLGGRPAITPV
jgi:glyoxylate reductase